MTDLNKAERVSLTGPDGEMIVYTIIPECLP
jgi:hypothetical protein